MIQSPINSILRLPSISIAILVSVFVLISTPKIYAESFELVAEDDWLPYTGVVNDKPTGIIVDIIKEAFIASGHEVNFVSRPFARCMSEVKNGTKLGCFNTMKSKENLQNYIFPKHAHLEEELIIYARADSKESNLTIKNLTNKTVGIVNGYTYGDEFENNKSFNREISQSELANLKMLKNKRVDYVVVFKNTFHYIISQNRDLEKDFKAVGKIGKLEAYINFSKSHPQTKKAVDAFEKGLLKIKTTGDYDRIFKNWANKIAQNDLK